MAKASDKARRMFTDRQLLELAHLLRGRWMRQAFDIGYKTTEEQLVLPRRVVHTEYLLMHEPFSELCALRRVELTNDVASCLKEMEKAPAAV